MGAGRAELPTAAVIDSQSVKAADTVGAATSGFGGKKIKGRKRHVAVDSNGCSGGGWWGRPRGAVRSRRCPLPRPFRAEPEKPGRDPFGLRAGAPRARHVNPTKTIAATVHPAAAAWLPPARTPTTTPTATRHTRDSDPHRRRPILLRCSLERHDREPTSRDPNNGAATPNAALAT
jgi:hypothetical protein